MSEFEKTLRFGRKDKKLTQREMAEMSGISPGDIARLESGVYVSLDKKTLNRISSIIGMDAGIFAALYHSEFQQELRKNRTDRPNPDNTEPPLPPELMDIIEKECLPYSEIRCAFANAMGFYWAEIRGNRKETDDWRETDNRRENHKPGKKHLMMHSSGTVVWSIAGAGRARSSALF